MIEDIESACVFNLMSGSAGLQLVYILVFLAIQKPQVSLCLGLFLTHARTHARTHTCIHTHARTHTQTHTRTHTYTHTHARTHARTHTCMHTHTHTHTHTHARTHARTRTHTHTQSYIRATGVKKERPYVSMWTLRPNSQSVYRAQCRYRKPSWPV